MTVIAKATSAASRSVVAPHAEILARIHRGGLAIPDPEGGAALHNQNSPEAVPSRKVSS